MNPFSDAFANVLTVQIQGDLTGTLQRQEGLDDGGQFHSVVGGLEFATKYFPDMLA
jgi:hypothetical protein